MSIQDVNNSRLAEALGVAPSTVGHWRTGKIALPDRNAMRAVADFFNRPIAEVLIRAGYATATELDYSAPPLADPTQLASSLLVDEIRARLERVEELEARVAELEAAAAATPVTAKRTAPDKAPRTSKARVAAAPEADEEHPTRLR
ncbi:helix-turn-helix transcriptional regulator [Nocardia otitidiscaviarum]|uniref:helix-turn-helix transcriptional regulator n=1 Tax=Nocardia otitidiscaviarum TaxID=1823 RepID=UPI0024575101|nr:helix-turn-helix transcriptional regulator [Nocardia otitidiscaviarum]